MRKQQRNDDVWCGVPPELLELIAEKLSIMDYLSCRGVCSSWRKAIDDAIRLRAASPLPIPFLFSLPLDPNHSPKLLSIQDHKVYNFSHDLRTCLGSVAGAAGWLISQTFSYLPEEDLFTHLSIKLYNPVSCSECILPRLPLSFGDYSYRTCKMVVSSSPDSPDLLAAVSIQISNDEGHIGQKLAFCNVNGVPWKFIEFDPDEIDGYLTDIAIHDGKLYGINTDNELEVVMAFDLRDPDAVTAQRVVMLDSIPNRMLGHYEEENDVCMDDERSYLVTDFTKGELLLVLHRLDEIESEGKRAIRTKGFRVFKLDASGGRWLKIDNLGDRLLLLDADGVQIISATNEFCNCVIFNITNTLSVDDTGFFSFSDRSIRHFSPNSPVQVKALNWWFTPSLW